ERLVDLDLVEREHQQLAQRGISRSEVVERDGDAKIFELPQDWQTFGRRLNKRRFGYLELQAFGCQAGLSKRAYHDIDQVVLSELDGGEIDRHLDFVRPGCSLGAGRLHQPLANLRDHAGFFGERDELVWQNYAFGRMPPADERLRSADPERLRIDDRLVVHLELVVQNGTAQLALKLVTGA